MKTGYRFSGALASAALLVSMAGVAFPAFAADGIAQLQRFVSAVQGAEGEFEQVVTSQSGRRPQEASGSFAYSRPGRFHWEYAAPYRQALVGDGRSLWSWDPDLNQVTVREIGDALGATPAAILFGSTALEDGFELAEGGELDGLAWVDARPKNQESGFEALRIGMANGELRRMEMRDHFGQTTVIRFLRLRANPVFDEDRFRFSPPPGADLIGEAPGVTR